jgi:hypothetical protein
MSRGFLGGAFFGLLLGVACWMSLAHWPVFFVSFFVFVNAIGRLLGSLFDEAVLEGS